MENKTKIIDLYKGFEGELGYFFASTDKNNNIHFYIKAWQGYIYDIFNKDPHMPKKGWYGFTKLYQEVLDNFTYGLDNFYKVENKKEFLDDLLWYRDNKKLTNETLTLLTSLIELTELSINEDLDLLIANDTE